MCRLNPDKGYTVDNCVLCCLEFNHSLQWTLEKIRELQLPTPDDYEEVDFSAPEKKIPNPPTKRILSMVDGVEHRFCNGCQEAKVKSDFGSKKVNCKKCEAPAEFMRTQTPRRHMMSLLSHSQEATEKRNKRGRGHLHDIDFDYLIDLYKKQRGRCAYSDIKMVVGARQGKSWVMSLERLNTALGYIKGNVALICHEFNSWSWYWNRQKVKIVRDNLADRYFI